MNVPLKKRKEHQVIKVGALIQRKKGQHLSWTIIKLPVIITDYFLPQFAIPFSAKIRTTFNLRSKFPKTCE